jgi:RNA polymerase sigma-70 factor (ECF subfamily)
MCVMADPASPAALDRDEAALLEALRAGDDRAYETLVRTYGGRMLAVAQRLLGSEDDARDALQDAFISAFRAIHNFSGGSRISTWLHRITVNAALMKLRARRSRPEQSIEDLLPRFLDDGHQAETVADWQDTAEVAVAREETRAAVRSAIAELPQDYRIVMQLRDIEELSTEETAEVLGLSINATKTRLHRARQALRTLLDRRHRGAAV